MSYVFSARSTASPSRSATMGQLVALLKQLVQPLQQAFDFGVQNSSLVPAAFTPQQTFGWLATAVLDFEKSAIQNGTPSKQN